LRLFTALLPDKKAKSELAALCKKFFAANVTREENLHITLKFLGEQGEEACRAAAGALCRAKGFGGLVLQPTGLGRMGRNRDLVYCGLKDETGRLGALFERLEDGFLQCGFEKETRPYFPHITLCRRYLGPLPEMEPDPFHMGACALMRSVRQDGRLCYLPLCTVELEG
jgi:2'-5' RNA ligase